MKDTLVLHHTADPSPDPQYQKVWAYHNSGAGGKWPKGHGIQYHYFIGKSGTVKQGHPDEFVCWNSGNWLINLRSIAICLAGDLEFQTPTPQQIDALTSLVQSIQTTHGIADARIFLHREIKKTNCPGTDLRKLVFEHRKGTITHQLEEAEAEAKVAPPAMKTVLDRLIVRLARLLSA